MALCDAPGIYDIPASAYHADPCPRPSLSSSIARELLAASPLHAWFAHPRLNPEPEPEEDDKFDVGTAAHAYLLEGEAGCVIVHEKDWRKAEARLAKAEARRAGKVPLLAHRWDDVVSMAEAARRQLGHHEDPPTPLTAGLPERTIVWREGDLWCRARLDWLHDDRATIDDYKSTSTTANPAVWCRGPLFGSGYDIQAAFYLRGLRGLTGIDATFRFVVQETFAPYALSVIALTPEVLTLADRKVAHALAVWRACAGANHWPAYPTRTCWAELPGWEETRWLEHEARAQVTMSVALTPIDDGRPLADQLLGGNLA